MRPFGESDLDAYTAVMQTERVRASLHLPADIGREQVWQQMATMLGQWELRGTGQWALEDRATGTFIGRTGLHWPERSDWPGVEVGWALHPRHWGYGYATEAGGRAVEYGFETVGRDELFSLILPPNTASQAVARRLGFHLVEERTLTTFPEQPHGIWRLERRAWEQARA
jgi:[ribosomal protein S5]-alanine N-acetyltransferase